MINWEMFEHMHRITLWERFCLLFVRAQVAVDMSGSDHAVETTFKRLGSKTFILGQRFIK